MVSNPYTDRLLLLMITSVLIIAIIVGMIFVFQHMRIFENQKVAQYYLENMILDERKLNERRTEAWNKGELDRGLIINETLNLSKELKTAVKVLHDEIKITSDKLSQQTQKLDNLTNYLQSNK